MRTSKPTTEPDGGPGRRRVLRAGAVAAGMTGLGAFAPHAARADDLDPLVLGTGNASSTATTLTIGADAGAIAPALALENADGPSLRLNALSASWAGALEVGEMAGTDLGPIVGVDSPAGVSTTYLVTGLDLANIATPFASAPTRVIDLRQPSGRQAVIRRSSARAIGSDGRLRAGEWIDISVALTGTDYALDAVFANLTVTGPTRGGHATLYPPGVRPVTSSLNFTTGQTIANAAFVGAGVVQEHHALRLTATADAWFVLDVTGGVTRGSVQTPLVQAAAVRKAGGRVAVVSKLRRALGRTS